MSNLIPNAKEFLTHGKNVLLVGPHGTGKTESVLELAQELGIKTKYYSCSTMDPFTDLVGVPVPREKTDGSGRRELEMVRPLEVDEAEFIFFDEFNRADPKTLNAIFEIIQFGSINGEELPNLKACWAAMNPNDGNYQVEDVDPALVDRFDAYVEMKPRPSVQWMIDNGIERPIAKALLNWWNEQNLQKRDFDSYISPRRLYKIGQMYQLTGDFEVAIPAWIKIERTKLRRLLRDAKKAVKDKSEGRLGQGAASQFNYTSRGLLLDKPKVVKYLEENPDDFDTHNRIIKVLRRRQVPQLVRNYREMMNVLNPSLLEGMLVEMEKESASRARKLREDIEALPPNAKDQNQNLVKIVTDTIKKS